MTSIGGHQQAILQAIQPFSLRLAAGQPVQARILGPTRHGVSILIGRESFQLHAPSKLANAETLTLQGTRSPSASGQQVKIIALDNSPLREPVEARLTLGIRTSQPDASTIVQKSEISVVANPVSPEGRVLGPSVTLRLQTSVLEAAVKPTVEQPKIDSGNKLAVAKNLPQQTLTDPGRLSVSATPSAHRPVTNAVHDQGSDTGVSKPELSDRLPHKVALTPASPLTSSVSPDPLTARARSSVDDVHLRADQSRQQQSVATSTLSNNGEPTSIKSTGTSPIINYRQGVVTEAKNFTQTPHSGELATAYGHGRALMASVVGRTSAGNVLLEAAGQLMRIEQPIDLPVGTTLGVTFASGLSASMTPNDPSAPEKTATLLNRLIGLLNDIDRAGRQATEPDLRSPTKLLPSPDRHLALRLLSFLSAEAGGQSIPRALSSSTERGGITVSQGDQIQAFVRELGDLASGSLADGWKSLTLPLGSDQGQAISLYFRDHDLDPDDEPSDGDAERKNAQRAIFDVSFSQIGRCQIDALCQDQRFDLLIRSEKPFGPENRRDVAALFVSACEIAGTKGEISFCVGSFFEPLRLSTVASEIRT